MTKRTINKDLDISDKNFKKLSIQVSLNGLSFCIADTVSHKVLLSGNKVFPEELNPQELLKQVKLLLTKHGLDTMLFDEVVVIHKNNLFSLVPKPLFEEKELENYLKFNIKLLATDAIAFDELENHEMMNVYVPYMNINNYIYELFGEFTYVHNGTVLIQSLLDHYSNQKNPICFVQVGIKQMDVLVLKQKKLLLYNSFMFETKEDFAYYLLFVMEQLDLNTESAVVKFFGHIEEDDDIFQLCYTYIKNVSIFIPTSPNHLDLGEPESSSIDFTVISTL
ncbi:DUF3822 family protein [Maribacter cobaltidurans]|uniref:Uncharacterized protein n=1 Tax=Maribacter cobaltidurans TaxID=1178778 RepID=A0A223V7S2_9FLAO|nr:DUF3822 family protein [Maribacter cobaltidurans]ASV31441.1 hypothetical protein CJ263_15115 [Maribacter cobaltidurans]GGD82223.1 hypothetical protein GCM10011412_20020 [Maribacter cobaltidurans]